MKRITLFVLLAVLVGHAAHAYDCSYTYNGKTLYYNLFVDGASVTYQTYDGSNYQDLNGIVSIPEQITNGSYTYPVVRIEERAFANCRGITYLMVPASVWQIGSGAFANCSSLKHLLVKSTTPPNISDDSFAGMPSTTVVHVPNNAVNTYKADIRWPNVAPMASSSTVDVNKVERSVTRSAVERNNARKPATVATPNNRPSNQPSTPESDFKKGEECYGRGEYAEAAQWYRKAADRGHASAQYYLGDAYFHGDGVPKDDAQAVYWFGKAAEQGVLDAQYNLAICYLHGKGTPQDNTQAAYWFLKAAEQGDASAQVNIAICYENGMGVEQNYEQAVYWFRLSADQDNAKAQCGLGRCYANGFGVQQDDNQALYWYRKAANQGQFEAQKYLQEHGY